MNIFFNLLKKTMVTTVFVIFGFVMTYVPQPFLERDNINEADAFIGGVVYDPTNWIQNNLSAVAEVAVQTKEFSLDAIATAAARNMVSLMVNDIVDWIDSGFEGKPAFVTDLRGFLLETADLTASDYIDELGGPGSFLCSAFQLDIQIALSINYEEQIREGRPVPECRISEFVTSLEDFIEGDFFAGGWESWFEITANPEIYTPYGALLTAQNDFNQKIEEAKSDVTKELDWGSGFFSGKTCTMVPGPDGPKENCTINKPGTTISASLNKALGAGQDTLVTADEINEIVGALINQLAQKAITGANGLLGLSGGRPSGGSSGGGSFVNNAQAQVSQNFNLAYIKSAVSDSLQLHQNLNTLAILVGPQLLSYANDTDNDATLRSQANRLYQETQTVRTRTNSLIPQLLGIQNRYTTLETEYNNSTTPVQRKSALQTSFIQLLGELSQSGAYTDAEYSSFENNWNTFLVP